MGEAVKACSFRRLRDEEEEDQCRIPRASRADDRAQEAMGEAARVCSCLRPRAWTAAWRILLLLLPRALTGNWACVWVPGATGGIRLLRAWRVSAARACTRAWMEAAHNRRRRLRGVLLRDALLLQRASRACRSLHHLRMAWRDRTGDILLRKACGAERILLRLPRASRVRKDGACSLHRTVSRAWTACSLRLRKASTASSSILPRLGAARAGRRPGAVPRGWAGPGRMDGTERAVPGACRPEVVGRTADS